MILLEYSIRSRLRTLGLDAHHAPVLASELLSSEKSEILSITVNTKLR